MMIKLKKIKLPIIKLISNKMFKKIKKEMN
jgi:hypothetical protein